MRKSVLAGLGLAGVLVAPTAAAGSTGPFVGDVKQGETDPYVYDNNPSGGPCLQLAATYTVSLHHVPPGDVLTLAAGTGSATSVNGAASVTVTSGVCARFTVSVSGTEVAGSATYVVTVTRRVFAPIS